MSVVASLIAAAVLSTAPGAPAGAASSVQAASKVARASDASTASNVTAEPDASGAAGASEPGTGVVTAQTVTIAGQDFAQYFLAAWRDFEGSDHYTLGIRERPSARFGSEVWIEYAQRRVFQLRLPAARAAIRALSEGAAETVWQTVLRTDLDRKLLRDADLAPDEL